MNLMSLWCHSNSLSLVLFCYWSNSSSSIRISYIFFLWAFLKLSHSRTSCRDRHGYRKGAFLFYSLFLVAPQEKKKSLLASGWKTPWVPAIQYKHLWVRESLSEHLHDATWLTKQEGEIGVEWWVTCRTFMQGTWICVPCETKGSGVLLK